MRRIRFIWVVVELLLPPLLAGDARADGGAIRLREAQGPFVITIFTASDPVVEAPVDVSVMVQSAESQAVILDAGVTLAFIPETIPARATDEEWCGMAGADAGTLAANQPVTNFSAKATHELASNKLLYAAPVRFGAAGSWKLEASVEKGGTVVKADCDILVGTGSRTLAALTPFLALPPVAVLLFGVNQFLRKPALEKALLLKQRPGHLAGRTLNKGRPVRQNNQ